MLDFRFLDFCREDTLYYDAPDRSGAEQDFHAGRVPGPGWTVVRGREWTVCTPPVLDIPDQGWKIHVSASPDNAEHLLDLVAPYCAEHGLFFKYINDRDTLSRRGSKYGDRTASGKFITLYPRDEEVLERTLTELEELVGGTPAPYILSDLRWGKGPLFVRYGAFVLKMTRGQHGTPVPAIVDPRGELVPDLRRPSFRPPEWVTLPGFLADALAERRRGTLKDFPFKVYKALHFSNGGGVYRAVDSRAGEEVLLKEARPLAGLDAGGADAVERMRREHWALTRLAGLPTVPALIDYRDGHEHRFLAREFVEGEPLVDLLRTRHPFASGDNTPAARAAYATWALGILAQVEDGIRAMHERGVVFGDLHPGNILVKPDGLIAFIDMETATAVEDNGLQHMGALGFHAPGHVSGAGVDLYGLAVLRLTMFVPMPQVVPWGVAKVRELIAVAAERFALEPHVVAAMEDGLGPDRIGSGTDYSVPWPADPVTGDLRDRIAASIVAAATPERDDRLYPGDATQFLTPGGGTTFAYGAAGVLWALARTGHTPPADHVRWLVEHAGTLEPCGPGFYTGLAGVAYTLEELGRGEAATALLDRALATPAAGVDDSLADGWSGLGLTALHLAARRDDPAYLDRAREVAARLGDPGDPGDAGTGRAPRVGLLYGRTGPALFLLRLFQRTGENAWLDAAVRELRTDLDIIGRDEATTALQLGGGLAGSAGLALVTGAVLGERPEDDLRRSHDALLAMARSQFAVPGGLFKGRAGAVLALAGHDEDPADAANLRAHADALGWEAVSPEPGRVDFIGDHGHRLSTDLATGSAGVLVALAALAGREGSLLPFTEAARQAAPA
ncbi:class III lanthionine synthetase LanKC [Streptomyces sp. NPDC051569]|uniref:class III lanthionine synthetase LanKC n=1 Tax=Streptomyces sp. NPDC051569 TaxID=3365661 RepID=UPI0037BD78DB